MRQELLKENMIDLLKKEESSRKEGFFCAGRRIRIPKGHQAAMLASPGAEPLGVSL